MTLARCWQIPTVLHLYQPTIICKLWWYLSPPTASLSFLGARCSHYQCIHLDSSIYVLQPPCWRRKFEAIPLHLHSHLPLSLRRFFCVSNQSSTSSYSLEIFRAFPLFACSSPPFPLRFAKCLARWRRCAINGRHIDYFLCSKVAPLTYYWSTYHSLLRMTREMIIELVVQL